MTKLRLVSSAVLLVCLSVLAAAPANAGTRFGGGLHYLRTLGDIKDAPGIDENDFGIIASAAFSGGLLRFEGDVEFIPDYLGSGELMWEPQAYAFLGEFIYGGVGVGIGHLGGGFGWQDPFFALRAGVDFMLGGLDLDAFASYRFQKAKDLSIEGVSDDLNSITFGAIIRFGS